MSRRIAFVGSVRQPEFPRVALLPDGKALYYFKLVQGLNSMLEMDGHLFVDTRTGASTVFLKGKVQYAANRENAIFMKDAGYTQFSFNCLDTDVYERPNFWVYKESYNEMMGLTKEEVRDAYGFVRKMSLGKR
jgi:hypothetical protein